MYGLVNNSIEHLIQSRHGVETWSLVRGKANVKEATFASMQPYPDELTYRLVAAASEVLGIPGDRFLEELGEHWMLYTAQEGYGSMLEMCGNSVEEFITNLDALHARVELSFPELHAPSFRYKRLEDGSAQLHYFSEREGLAPFVIGLIKGLGKRFRTPVDVSLVESKSSGADHDVFSIGFAT